MKKLFKQICTFTALALVIILPSFADMEIAALTAGTPSNVFSTPRVIENITVLANTTNNTILRGYDSSTTTTNIARAAYTSYSSYATNFSVVFTNSTGALVTNSFAGTYTAPTSNASVTNERPKAVVLAVPGSAQLSRDLNINLTRGLTLLSDYASTVTITYHPVTQ